MATREDILRAAAEDAKKDNPVAKPAAKPGKTLSPAEAARVDAAKDTAKDAPRARPAPKPQLTLNPPAQNMALAPMRKALGLAPDVDLTQGVSQTVLDVPKEGAGAPRRVSRPVAPPPGTMQRFEPEAQKPAPTTLAQQVTYGVRRGLVSMDAANALAQDDAKQYVRLQRLADLTPPSNVSQALSRGDINIGAALRKDPVAVIAETVSESLGGQVSTLPLVMAAGAVAGPVGSALASGAASYTSEYASALAEGLSKRGVDVRDVNALASALENRPLMNAVKADAAKGAIAPAAFDALTAGLAGKILGVAGKGVVRQVIGSAGEAAMQMTGGMAGETGKQLLVSGKVTNPTAIALEGIAELPGGVAETIGNVLHARVGAPHVAAAAPEVRGNTAVPRVQTVTEPSSTAAPATTTATATTRPPLMRPTTEPFTPRPVVKSVPQSAEPAPQIVTGVPGIREGVPLSRPAPAVAPQAVETVESAPAAVVPVTGTSASNNRAGDDLSAFAERYARMDDSGKEQLYHMVKDQIETKRAAKSPYTNLTQRLAIMDEINRGDTPAVDAIYSNKVEGHPENITYPLTQGLVPYFVRSVAQAEAKIDAANAVLSDAAGQLAQAEYALKTAKTPAAKNKARDRIAALRDKQGIHADAINAIREETIPELNRMLREAQKAYATAQVAPVVPSVPEETPTESSTQSSTPVTPEPARVKEPWEMTREEYIASRFDNERTKGISSGAPESYRRQHEELVRDRLGKEYDNAVEMAITGGEQVPTASKPLWARTQEEHIAHSLQRMRDANNPDAENPRMRELDIEDHRESVELALNDGKPVPPEVLSDYPDLARQYGVADAAVEKVADTASKDTPLFPWEEGIAWKPLEEKAVFGNKEILSALPTEEFWRWYNSFAPGPERAQRNNVLHKNGIYLRKSTRVMEDGGHYYLTKKTGKSSSDEVSAERINANTPEAAVPDAPPATLRATADEVSAERINANTPEAELNITPGLRMQDVSGKPRSRRERMAARTAEQRQMDEQRFAGEEQEERFQQATAPTRAGTWEAIKDWSAGLYRRATRMYEDLPNGARFENAREALRQLSGRRGYNARRVAENLQSITVNLSDVDYDLFRRKVLLDDLREELSKQGDEGNGALPYGFTRASLQEDGNRIDALSAGNQYVQDALAERKRIWDSIKNEYLPALKEAGYDASKLFNRENYFRHIVIDYLDAQQVARGTGKKLRTPTGRGYQKGRTGSSKDIISDYLTAEHEVMLQMLTDIDIANTINRMQREYDISARLKAEASARGNKNIEIPDGYTTYQPRDGQIFYMTRSVSSHVWESFLQEQFGKGFDLSDGGDITLPVDAFKQVLAVGGKRREMIIPVELADTLTKLTDSRDPWFVENILDPVTKTFKAGVLMSPTRVIRYNLRNVSSDLEAVIRVNPGSLVRFVKNGKAVQVSSNMARAARELYQMYFSERAATGDLRDWMALGGEAGLVQAQETGDLKHMQAFADFIGKKDAIPVRIWNGYWKTARLSSDYREAILRYANYLDYLDQMNKSTDGTPQNFGASDRQEVLALSDRKERAYKLANELLGDYDRLTAMGRDLRRSIIPFWSWMEVNFRREVRIFKNAVQDGRVGRSLVAKAPFAVLNVARSSGKWVAGVAAALGLLSLYNNTGWRKELEEDLPDEERNLPHIVLWRNADGSVRTFTRLGALNDFLDMFGMDSAPREIREAMNGRMSWREALGNIAIAPINRMIQGVTPIIKTPAELISGYRIFPDVRKPRPIKDVPAYIADTFTVGQPFRALTGRPTRQQEAQQAAYDLASYTTYPDESAYYDVLTWKNRFLESRGKRGQTFGNPTTVFNMIPATADDKKDAALWQLKRAARLGDKRAMAKYAKAYAENGGTRDGLDISVRNSDPLHGLGDLKDDFVASLTPREQRRLKLAQGYAKKIGEALASVELPAGKKRATRKRPLRLRGTRDLSRRITSPIKSDDED